MSVLVGKLSVIAKEIKSLFLHFLRFVLGFGILKALEAILYFIVDVCMEKHHM